MPWQKGLRLNATQIAYLAQIGCSEEEIARTAGVSRKTLRSYHLSALQEGRALLRKNPRGIWMRVVRLVDLLRVIEPTTAGYPGDATTPTETPGDDADEGGDAIDGALPGRSTR